MAGKERGFDIHISDDNDRPLRWIHFVTWSIVIIYLCFALIGVLTTPVENGRPVLADAEFRQRERYVATITQYINEMQNIHDTLTSVVNAYRIYATIRGSEALTDIEKNLKRLAEIREHLSRMTVPARFSGVIGVSRQGSTVNERAFHSQFQDVVDTLIAFAEELYRYFTDYNENRWSTIDSLNSAYQSRASETYSLFRLVVGNQLGGR